MILKRPLLDSIHLFPRQRIIREQCKFRLHARRALVQRHVEDERQIRPTSFDSYFGDGFDFIRGKPVSAKLIRQRAADEAIGDDDLSFVQRRQDRFHRRRRAKRYADVTAIEPALACIQFMQQRFAQENIPNVRIVRTSASTLPFAAGSFDLIFMNGVLERLAAEKRGQAKEAQAGVLRNAARLLRRDGYLCIGARNRWAAARNSGAGSRSGLHSIHGYRRLLRDAGFTRVEPYLALPAYEEPRFLVPFDDEILAYYAQSLKDGRSSLLLKAAHAVLVRLGLTHYLKSSFLILARR